MARVAHVHESWSSHELERFSTILDYVEEQHKECHLLSLELRWKHWVLVIKELKRLEQEEEQRRRVVEILLQSNRGHRSTMEKETLRKFITLHLTCLPRSLTQSEMDKICNEIDWIPLTGRSVLFLQGDFGNVYYMIAKGTVGLYLEPSKDREMAIAREFGHLRGQAFRGTNADLQRLGNNIFNLPKGAGFGEYAILATTNKIRSCAAVALDEDSMMLIMHADTYNAVLRHHHYRQKQLSSATNLLQEMPLFKSHNYSKIAALAYTMKSQTYSSGVVIARSGDVINNVLVVASGQVKVFASATDIQANIHLQQEHAQHNSHAVPHYAQHADMTRHHHTTPTHTESDESAAPPTESQRLLMKRIPKLAVVLLGKGNIIGESEVHKGLRTFQMTYETCAASTEILEMPATVFKESIQEVEFKQSSLYKSIEVMQQEQEQSRVSRLTRAYSVMKKMMEGDVQAEKKKQELLCVLPGILEPAMSQAAATTGCRNLNCNSSSGGRNAAKARIEHLATAGVYNLDDAERVQRRSSTQVPFSTIRSPSAPNTSELAGLVASVALQSSTQQRSSLHQSPSQPAGSVRSPRKLKFGDSTKHLN